MPTYEREALRQQRELREQQQQKQTERRVKAVLEFAQEGVRVREAAEVLGINKETVVKYRRLAGLTPPPPLRHLGGGRWVKAEDEGEERKRRRPFRK